MKTDAEPGPVPPARRASRALALALRSRRAIVVQIGLYVVFGVLSTVVPQAGEDPARWETFLADHPVVARAAHGWGLDHVFGSAGFLALVLLSAASLGVVLADQWRRVAREWGRPLPAAAFERAPYRAELTRLATGAPGERRWTTGRASDLGSPLFHVGLLAVIAAGLVRMLLGASAQVDLVEGGTVPASAAGWGAQWPGRLAAPVALEQPVTLVRVDPERHASGELRQLGAELAVGAKSGEIVRVEVNRPYDLGGTRLYLGQLHGPAVFVEVLLDGRTDRKILLLRPGRGGGYEGSEVIAPGTELRVRAGPADHAGSVSSIEVRLLRRGGLLVAAEMEPGARASLEAGGSVHLVAVRRWLRLSATRDPSRPLAYLGFAVILVGTALMFGVVRIDWSVSVARDGDRERVIVAMRPRRFAPLYRERFERLVARERAGTG